VNRNRTTDLVRELAQIMTTLTRLLAATVVLALQPTRADDASTTRLAVYPAEISLDGKTDRQSVVVQVIAEDGITRDATNTATYQLADPSKARLENQTLIPVSDGETSMTVQFEELSAKVPVRIRESDSDRPVSFRLDVMPIFMRAGCNAGRCHGAAKGKDGFRLSLFGYDPEGDYFRLTRELPGRRINLDRPDDCLLTNKALGRVVHTGGQRVKPESELHRTLLRWLEAGAPNDPPDVAVPVALELLPERALLLGKGGEQRLTARARYSDGTDRDVTSLCLFLSNNDGAATVSDNGTIKATGPGEAFVMARFAKFTVGSRIAVVPEGAQVPSMPGGETSYIDRLVNAKLRSLRITPADMCSDEEYLRRAFLDLVGRLPTADDHDRFVSSDDPKKRDRLADELIGRPEFVDLWTMIWSEQLQVRTANGVSYKAMLRYRDWLREQLAADVPMDRIVHALLASNGGTLQNPPTNFYQAETNPVQLGENVAQVFLGMRIQCAQCHNHPFDRWTMDDYYGFTAFLTRVGYKQAQDPREVTVFDKGAGEVRHPVDNRVVSPRFLGGAVPDAEGKDYRVVLADWLVAPDNPFFARNLVNRVWAHFLGMGIVDPVDDVRVSNPPSNPELLNALAQHYVDSGFNLKSLVREIVNSRTYQRATRRNESNAADDRNFSHGAIRRIRAEVLLDCISQVTETQDKFPGLPAGARAVQIVDGQVTNYFLTTFGRATRNTVCTCEVRREPSLSQALHLLNGDTTGGKISSGQLVSRLLEAGRTPDQVVDDLYVRCLGRKPTSEEFQQVGESIREGSDGRTDLEDLFWALLNSKEFLFNH
jgi:hypothetical protein